MGRSEPESDLFIVSLEEDRERKRERKDRVNDCSALQSEGASEPETFFFPPSRAVIKVSDLLVPFEFSLSRTLSFLLSCAHT